MIKAYSILFPLSDRELKAWEEILDLASFNHPDRSSVQELNKFKQRFYGYQMATSSSSATAVLARLKEQIKAELKAEILAELKQ